MGSAFVAEEQAEQLKREGNNYLKKGRVGAAIDAYTQATTLSPDVPMYWTNRAVCHRQRNGWKKVEEDSRKATEVDQSHAEVLEADTPTVAANPVYPPC